jgi:hypothetical protein
MNQVDDPGQYMAVLLAFFGGAGADDAFLK